MNSEMIQQEKETEIDWMSIFSAILRRWWLVLICLVTGAGIGFGLGTVAYVPAYESRAVYVVSYSGDNFNISSSSLAASASFMPGILYNCTEILSQNAFFKDVETDLNEGYAKDSPEYVPAETIQRCIKYSYTEETGSLIYVTVTTGSMDLTGKIMKAVTANLTDYIAKTYVLAGEDTMEFSLVNTPEDTTGLVASNTRTMYTVLGAVLLTGICVVILGLVAVLDDRIKKEEDLRNRFKAPVLGTIPNFFDPEIVKGGYYRYGYSAKS